MSLEELTLNKNQNYWMLLCNPNKWFGESNTQNAKVNDLLSNLTEFWWTTGRNSFDDIKDGDLGIIKVGNDHRSIACRTLDDSVQDKLKAGIYAIIRFTPKEGKLLKNDENGVERVHFEVVKNLFYEDTIIDKEKTEKVLGKSFKSFSSKRISEEIFQDVINEIPKTDYSNSCLLRGCFDSLSSEWNNSSLDEKVELLKSVSKKENKDSFTLALGMMNYCNKEANKEIKEIDIMLSLCKIIDHLIEVERND